MKKLFISISCLFLFISRVAALNPAITFTSDTLILCQGNIFRISFLPQGNSGVFGVGVDVTTLKPDSVSTNICVDTTISGGLTYFIFSRCSGSSLDSVNYSVEACSIFPPGWTAGQLPNQQTIEQQVKLFQNVGGNWTPYSGTYIVNGNTVSSGSSYPAYINSFFPLFNHLDTPDTLLKRGDSYIRSLVFNNNGGTTPGDFSGYVRFCDSVFCPAISIDSVQFRIGGYTFPARSYVPRSWIAMDLDSLIVPQGGSIEIKEYIHITGCLDACNHGSCQASAQADTTNISSYFFEWGCDSLTLCRLVNQCTKITSNPNRNPSIFLSRKLPAPLSPNIQDGIWENSCPGDITHWVFRLSNRGTANAYNIKWSLGTGFSDNYVLLINPNNSSASIYFTNTSGNTISLPLHTVPSNYQSNCITQAAAANPLDSCYVTISELAAGEFIEFHFSTLRCCPDDSSLFNTAINFNKFKMEVLAYGECSTGALNNLPIHPNPPDSGLFIYTPNVSYDKSISLNGISSEDIQMNQALYPSTSDLTGITRPDPDCNPAGYSFFRVLTSNFLPLNANTGAIFSPAYATDDDSILIHGRIKVNFKLQPGLQLSQPSSVPHPVSFSTVAAGSLVEWLPLATVIPDSCKTNPTSFNQYNFEFDFSNLPLMPGNLNQTSLKNFREFINGSSIDFYMNACCCSDLGLNDYTISVLMNANPNNCSTCWMPLAQTGNEINVHCPGCTTPGIIVDYFKMERSLDAGTNSYGYQDANDNGRADGINNPLQIDSAYLANHPQVRRNFSIQGDFVNASVSAHFTDGVPQVYDSTLNLMPGCTYAQWMNAMNDTLDHIYLDQNIPFSSVDKFNLQIHASTLRIIRTNPSLPVLPNSMSGNRTYIDINLFQPNNLITTPGSDTSKKEFFYNLSLSALRGNNSALPGSYIFQPGDSFEIKTTYKVCNNFNNNGQETSGDPDLCRHESDVSNVMYLTATNQNYGAAFNPACWAGDVWTSCLSCDSNDIDSLLLSSCLFKCQTYGGFHYFLDIQTINTTTIKNVKINSSGNDRCASQLFTNSIVRMGGNATNVFPFEFRPAKTPLRFDIQVPQNYSITDGNTGTYFNTYHEGCIGWTSHLARLYSPADIHANACSNTPTCPGSVFSNFASPPYRFPYRILDEDTLLNSCSGGCLGDRPAEMKNCQDTLIIGDEYFNQTVYLELSPLCDSTLQITYFNDTIIRQLFPKFSCTGDSILENVSNINGTDSLVNSHPILTFTPSNTPTAYSDSVCWDLSIRNIATSQDAQNVFIFIPNTNPDFEFTWAGFQNSMVSAPVYGFDTIGKILSGATAAYRLCGRLLNCDTGSVEVFYGWNCDSLPDTLTHACFYKSYSLNYTLAASTAQASLNIPPNYYLCRPSLFELDIQNSNIGAFSIDSLLIQPVPNATINPLCSLSYTHGLYNLIDTIRMNNQNKIYLSSYNNASQFFAHDSVNGIGSLEHVKISFNFTTSCNYNNDTLPLIKLYTTSYCGQRDSLLPMPDSTWLQSGDSCSPPCTPLYVNINSIPVICSGDTVNLSASVSGGQAPYTYLWTGPSFGSSLTSPPVAPTATTTYTLTITDSSIPIRTGIAYITVNVINNSGNCCIPSTFKPNVDYDFSNTTATQVSQMLGINFLSTQNIILINGTFTVDTLFTFQSCTNIIMGPNARIDVLSGANCVMLSCVVQACSEMWKSIVAKPGSRLFIGDSHINDGIEAVYSYGTPVEVTIKGNFFNRNHVAIRFDHGNFAGATITGNTFSCTATLKDPYTAKYTEAQIYLEDAKEVKIGNGTSTINYIYDGQYGINALRSDFKVNNNFFGNHNNPNPNAAIYSSGQNGNSAGPLFTAEIGIDYTNTIEDYFNGILVAQSYNVYIKNNTIRKIGRGIIVSKCFFAQIYIDQNQFENFSVYGVNAPNNFKAELFIRNNTFNQFLQFNLVEESRKGIYINNASKGPSTLLIQSNFIANCRDGIQLMNQENGLISGNQIFFRIPDSDIPIGSFYRHGILLQSSSTTIDTNRIIRNCSSCTTDPAMNGYLNGITLSLSNTHTHSNYIKNVPTAISLIGNCYLSNLFCNIMDSCQQGFLMVNDSLQQQGDSMHTSDNQWVNWLGSYKIEGSLACGISCPVPWYWDQGLGSSYDPNPFDGNVIAPYFGLTDSACFPIIPSKKMQEEIYNLVLDTSGYGPVDENRYQDLVTGYETLKQNMQLMYSGTTFDASLQNFFSLIALENIGVLSEIKEYLCNNDLANALLLNNYLSPENLMESNSQYLNEIVIESKSDTIKYNSTQKSVLRSIAYQNPIVGGEAVFRARAILNLDIEDAYLPYRFYSTSDSSTVPQAFLFPNPNKGKFTIHFLNQNEGTFEYSIYNSLGKIIKIVDHASSDNLIPIDVSSLDQGIYFIDIKFRTNHQVLKLIIIH